MQRLLGGTLSPATIGPVRAQPQEVERRRQSPLIISEGADPITAARGTVYPSAACQLCLAHWFRFVENLTPAPGQARRRNFRHQFR